MYGGQRICYETSVKWARAGEQTESEAGVEAGRRLLERNKIQAWSFLWGVNIEIQKAQEAGRTDDQEYRMKNWKDGVSIGDFFIESSKVVRPAANCPYLAVIIYKVHDAEGRN